MVVPLIMAGAALVGGFMSASNSRKSARAKEEAAKNQYSLDIERSRQITNRFKYNRIRERLNAQRFTGKQITAFANSGVSGRSTLSVIEDTIGLVEESLFNKQIDAEFQANAVKRQADINLALGKAGAKAERRAGETKLLTNSVGTFSSLS